ncbi:OmpA family protein [Spirosoma sp. KCTC 42546]|uniref:OmpA family protein n=1 Tax=Spirosoma sp. KCTC 42546 TaxID=2520506 RepID=UPI001AEFB93E|nr:OmpA family protein [Spirosoma sp. KCTC 42546]
MAVNLLDLTKGYLSDSVVSQISTMLGENQPNTQKALDGALPTMLGSLIQKASEPGGTSSIMDLVGEVMSPNRAAGDVITPIGGISGQLSNLLTNSHESSSLLTMGASIIKSLFGDKASTIASSLASYSGLKLSSAASLMNIAAPVLLSVLGKKLADDGTGISGLAGLLSSQSANVQSALPSGLGTLLGSIPGLGILGSLTGKASNLASAMNEPAPRIVRPTAPIYSEDDTSSSGGGNRWLPWLLLLLGAAALFYILRGCGKEKETATNAAESVTATVDSTVSDMSTIADSAGSTIGAAVDSAGNAAIDVTAKLGAFFKRKLPSGIELNIPENGIENQLVQFIEDKSKPVDKTTWFNFGRLLFETGKASLKPSSKEEVKNIAEILKAFPEVNIKLGGYTDNTGSAAINKKLSQERADAVMTELVHLGIDTSRLAAEGYGPEHPVASNDTEAGRAENRRIAVRVTKK